MHPWGTTTKPCIVSKERTKSDLIRAFYCALDSILSARTRALKSLCAVLACPREICVSGVTKACSYGHSRSTASTAARTLYGRPREISKKDKVCAVRYVLYRGAGNKRVRR